jgi:hypothetical protein
MVVALTLEFVEEVGTAKGIGHLDAYVFRPYQVPIFTLLLRLSANWATYFMTRPIVRANNRSCGFLCASKSILSFYSARMVPIPHRAHLNILLGQSYVCCLLGIRQSSHW